MFAVLLAVVVQFDPRVLQSYEVSSASGEWRAAIDPSSKNADGPSNVRVERAGVIAWKAELPFTFVEAVLADSGHLAGYGYTHGFPQLFTNGEFVVAVIGPEGQALVDDRTLMESSRALHGPANPLPWGVFLDGAQEQFVVRVADRDLNSKHEAWWRYTISSGARLEPLNPRRHLSEPADLWRVVDTVVVPETPLILVEWYWPDFSTHKRRAFGSYFALLDDEGKPVWTLARAREFTSNRSESDEQHFKELGSTPGILGVPGPRQFELRLISDAARVTYEIRASADATTWDVREIARAPWKSEPTARPPVAAPVPPLELATLSTVALNVRYVPESERTEIVAFEPQPSGALRFVRCRGMETYELCTTDESGQPIRTVPLDGWPERPVFPLWLPLSEQRWLAVIEDDDEIKPTRAWIADGKSGTVNELKAFPDWRDLRLARIRDGGFVVLSCDIEQEKLAGFDANGEQLWEIQRGENDIPSDPDESEVKELSTLYGAEDVAVGADGQILVLINHDHSVQVLDARGTYRTRVIVPPPSADEDHYLTDILVDPSGHLLVYNFDLDQDGGWIRIDREGRIHGLIRPRRADGTSDVDIRTNVTVDASGVLWSSFGDEILSFDAQGIATTRFGARPSPSDMHEPEWIQFDERQRVVIIDGRSRAALAFRIDGEIESVVAAPGADLGDVDAFSMRISSGPNGRHLVQPEESEDRWIELDASGRRVAVRELGGERAAWLPDGGFWVAKGSKYYTCYVRRITADGAVSARIDRQPDGRFFEEIHALGLGPDGGIALLAGMGQERSVFLHDGQGKLLRSLQLPWDRDVLQYAEAISWRGDWVVVSSFSGTAYLLSLRSGATFRVVGPDSSDAWSLSPDGREMWCARTAPPSLLRFALPK